jgi:hypothetical protein
MIELIEEGKNTLEGRVKPPPLNRPILGGYNTEIAKITTI